MRRRQGSLADLYPDLAEEADGWDPGTVSPGVSDKLAWHCRVCGHRWSATVYSRARLCAGCPPCARRRVAAQRLVLPAGTSLAELRPDLASEAEGWNPAQFRLRSRKRMPWRCATCSHPWETRIEHRANGAGCPRCAARRRGDGLAIARAGESLLDTHPAIAAEADGWDPSTVKPRSNRKVPWRCDVCDHRWSAPPSNRVGGSGCPQCGHKRVAVFRSTPQPGQSLADMFPDLAAEADGWDPSQYSYGSETKMPWRCGRGHQWTATLNNRTNSRTGCPFCVGHRIEAGFNDLATTHPALAVQADGWDPTVVGFGSNAKVPWLCQEGHRWHATIVNRAVRDRGCPACARTGYDQSRPGYFYIKTVRDATTGDFLAWKFGITNDLVKRSATLRYSNRGLVTLGHVLKIHDTDGRRIRDLETAVRTELKRRGVCRYLPKAQMPVGYSETINPDLISLVEVRRLIADYWAALAC